MWTPETEDEILARVEAGDLEETASFDAKEEVSSSSKELAKDVAAMTLDGGVLVYGIGEDEDDRLTRATPFELAGVRERIDMIVRTCIAEPPEIEIRPIPTDDDPTVGYVVVIAPPSPRAPHMVTKNNHNRYYGRGPTGNRRLSEGEVARLYQRRQLWETDTESWIDELLANAPLDPQEGKGYLHVAAKPLHSDRSLVERAAGEERSSPDQFLQDWAGRARHSTVCDYRFSPDFDVTLWHRHTNGWTTYMHMDPEREAERDPNRTLDVHVDFDGSARLFSGRVADTVSDVFYLHEEIAAGLTTRFLYLLGRVYAAGEYHGPVDLALAITGIEGAVSYAAFENAYSTPRSAIGEDTYQRSARVQASTLIESPQEGAIDLLSDLFEATTQGRSDPWN